MLVWCTSSPTSGQAVMMLQVSKVVFCFRKKELGLKPLVMAGQEVAALGQ